MFFNTLQLLNKNTNKKEIILVALLSTLIVYSCRKNELTNHLSNDSHQRNEAWTPTTDSIWLYGVNNFLADVVGDSIYDSIEMHRGLRYLEAGLNYTLCPSTSGSSKIIENTFTTSFSIATISEDSIISGTDLKTLYTDTYQSISDLADTTLVDSGYDHFINSVDLVWNDPTGNHSEISPLNLEIHVYHAIVQDVVQFCIDPGWSVEEGSGSCGVPAYSQFKGALNRSDCNPYLGCVYVFGAPTDVYTCNLDSETKNGVYYFNPTQCYTRAQMQDFLDEYESISHNHRPIAFNGSTKNKTILPSYITYLKILSGDVGVGMEVTYANCFHTWVERPLNPIFHPSE